MKPKYVGNSWELPLSSATGRHTSPFAAYRSTKWTNTSLTAARRIWNTCCMASTPPRSWTLPGRPTSSSPSRTLQLSPRASSHIACGSVTQSSRRRKQSTPMWPYWRTWRGHAPSLCHAPPTGAPQLWTTAPSPSGTSWSRGCPQTRTERGSLLSRTAQRGHAARWRSQVPGEAGTSAVRDVEYTWFLKNLLGVTFWKLFQVTFYCRQESDIVEEEEGEEESESNPGTLTPGLKDNESSSETRSHRTGQDICQCRRRIKETVLHVRTCPGAQKKGLFTVRRPPPSSRFEVIF